MARPSFPTIRDLPNLSADDATRALEALRRLVATDMCDVYTAAGSNDTFWNVWDNVSRQRVELSAWADAWLAEHRQSPLPPVPPSADPPASSPPSGGGRGRQQFYRVELPIVLTFRIRAASAEEAKGRLYRLHLFSMLRRMRSYTYAASLLRIMPAATPETAWWVPSAEGGNA